ncbi:MAG: DUF547 domain-containing protein, partial [Deltaproteobacteria bacterium]|nr:DUF547 domain-containing protein [Deltaproteobacteria bacterium]
MVGTGCLAGSVERAVGGGGWGAAGTPQPMRSDLSVLRHWPSFPLLLRLQLLLLLLLPVAAAVVAGCRGEEDGGRGHAEPQDGGPAKAADDAGGGEDGAAEASRAAFVRALRQLDLVLALAARRGCVDFAGLMQDAGAREALRGALAELATVQPEALPDRGHRLAFWLNAFTACLLQGIVEGLSGDPAWDVASDAYAVLRLRRCTLAGRLLSPDEIEHGVLRGQPGYAMEELHLRLFPAGGTDPRLHAALYLGSRSSPPLRGSPYTAEGLEAALDRQAGRWLDDPRRGAGPEGISAVFLWYSGDFAEMGVEGFIARHRSRGLPPAATHLVLPFSWELDRYLPEERSCHGREPEPCLPADEVCNGRDDDCDGRVDEELVAPTGSCSRLGPCKDGPEPICAGEAGWFCPPPPGHEEPEQSCDGLDNDCDGLVDEDLDPAAAGCTREGLCAQAPAPICSGGEGWSCPPPAGYESPEQSCDGLDNDCNGLIDDVALPPPGLCLHLGVCVEAAPVCRDGAFSCGYPATFEEEAETLCDGLD